MSLYKKMSCFGFAPANYATSKSRTLATERLKTSLLLLCFQWVLCIFYAAFVEYAPQANASYAWNSIDPVFGGFNQDKNVIKDYYTRKVYSYKSLILQKYLFFLLLKTYWDACQVDIFKENQFLVKAFLILTSACTVHLILDIRIGYFVYH